MKKIISILIISLVLVGFSASGAYAHVTVKPAQVGVAQRLNFVVSVPTEEEVPTIALRLVIPEGIKSVRPNVKPGWNIQIKRTGEGIDERVSEIIWTGGIIPADQRDEFVFSAQAPSEETSLVWKAYQTYGDGDVVSWDTDPKIVEDYSKKNTPMPNGEDDHNAPRPYSVTAVLDDLAQATPQPVGSGNVGKESSGSNMLSVIAIILSIAAIGIALKKKK